jgi:hypothetical protein
MVEGGRFVITEGNFRLLVGLSDEFEFAELSAACNDFSRSRLSVLELEPSGIVSRLLLCITAVEKRQQALERSLVTEQTKVSALESRTRVFEGLISRLSADRGPLAAEQAYRRGCEYLFGANGFSNGVA